MTSLVSLEYDEVLIRRDYRPVGSRAGDFQVGPVEKVAAITLVLAESGRRTSNQPIWQGEPPWWYGGARVNADIDQPLVASQQVIDEDVAQFASLVRDLDIPAIATYMGVRRHRPLIPMVILL
jgi:hypothetical protein